MRVNHDPFSRIETHRKTVKTTKECENCGCTRKAGLYQYSTVADSVKARSNTIKGLFCSIGCMRQYHDQ